MPTASPGGSSERIRSPCDMVVHQVVVVGHTGGKTLLVTSCRGTDGDVEFEMTRVNPCLLDFCLSMEHLESESALDDPTWRVSSLDVHFGVRVRTGQPDLARLLFGFYGVQVCTGHPDLACLLFWILWSPSPHGTTRLGALALRIQSQLRSLSSHSHSWLSIYRNLIPLLRHLPTRIPLLNHHRKHHLHSHHARLAISLLIFAIGEQDDRQMHSPANPSNWLGSSQRRRTKADGAAWDIAPML